MTEGALGASVLSYRPSDGEDGYFLLLASPEVKAPDAKPQPKTVIFVLDRSGSMAGKKIEQARRALKSVLNNLREDDLFNIVVYDDRVESFKPELERYSSRTREEAERFVDNIREGGTTNIDSALKIGPGDDPRRLAAQLRPVPDRRPAHRRRDAGAARSPTTAGRPTRGEPGSSASASASTSTPGCSIGSAAATAAPASTSSPTRTSRPTSAGSTPR